jgi:hypothetical protein
MQTLTALTLCFICLAGHPRFAVREQASAGLARLVDFCPSVVMAGEKHPDAEIAERCRIAVAGFYRRHAEALSRIVFPAGWTRLPWLDYGGSWPCDDLAKQTRWHSYSTEVGTDAVFLECTGRYREMTRLWVRDMIATRQPYRAELEQMATDENHASPEPVGMPHEN